MEAGEVTVSCCIAGGGPAGMMLGFLLARAGVSVLVLEKHADFLRDFRGDTMHPSTLEIMHELGLLGEFLQRPHQEAKTLSGQIGEDSVEVANFASLPTHCRFIAFMPQWDFLNFIAQHAKRYPRSLSDWSLADRGMERRFALRQAATGCSSPHRPWCTNHSTLPHYALTSAKSGRLLVSN